jgi:hypothetical protein
VTVGDSSVHAADQDGRGDAYLDFSVWIDTPDQSAERDSTAKGAPEVAVVGARQCVAYHGFDELCRSAPFVVTYQRARSRSGHGLVVGLLLQGNGVVVLLVVDVVDVPLRQAVSDRNYTWIARTPTNTTRSLFIKSPGLPCWRANGERG